MTKILGSLYNELTKARRSPYLAGITDWINTRTIVKRLAPSDEYLFGGKLAEVSKNLKDSTQVIIFLSFWNFIFKIMHF